MFYAYQVDEVGVWAHASSADLVHWVHHPIPLGVAPGKTRRSRCTPRLADQQGWRADLIYHGCERRYVHCHERR